MVQEKGNIDRAIHYYLIAIEVSILKLQFFHPLLFNMISSCYCTEVHTHEWTHILEFKATRLHMSIGQVL